MGNNVKERYVKTVEEIAGHLGMTRQAFHANWQNRDNNPGKVASGWPVQAWIKFIAAEKRERADRMGDGDAKRKKLLIECDILEEKLRQMRRETIPMQEHLAEFAEYAAAVNAVFDLWIQDVAVETKDARLLQRAEDLRDRARGRILEKLAEGAD